MAKKKKDYKDMTDEEKYKESRRATIIAISCAIFILVVIPISIVILITNLHLWPLVVGIVAGCLLIGFFLSFFGIEH